MAEIIQFGDDPVKRKPDDVKPEPASERWVWTCSCGNSTFQLIHGGACRCAYCNEVSTTMAHFAPNAK